MTQNLFHNENASFKTPPARMLPVLEKAKAMYKQWIEIHRNMERSARFGIGNKVDSVFLTILELLRKSAYSPINMKVILLQEAIEHIDSFRFFFQLLWEVKLVTREKYISFGVEIENLGKMAGGWKKGLANKTSAVMAEERK